MWSGEMNMMDQPKCPIMDDLPKSDKVRLLICVPLLALLAAVAACAQQPTGTLVPPSPTMQATATPAPTPDIDATIEAGIVAGIAAAITNTPVPTSVPTSTPLPSPTPMPAPTATPSPEPTPTFAPTPTLPPTAPPTSTATPLPTASPTATPSPEPTPTLAPTPTLPSSATPSSTATPLPTASPTAAPTATPSPEPTPTFAPTSTPPPTAPPTSTATPVPTSTPTLTPSPETDPYVLMLELVNEARAEAGLSEVVMGDNLGAQIHADNLLANCISSHWSADGLDGGMRYSLAGGYQANSENVSGSDYCRLPNQGYSLISNISNEVQKAMDGWMNSPGHKTTILNARHRKVNIGLALDSYNFVAVQQFEGDFVEFTSLPTIEDGELSMEGTVKNGANLEHGDHFRVVIDFRPPPHDLTRGQIARVYGICLGRKVAHLSYRSDGEVETTWKTCPSPYDFPPESSAPSSGHEAHQFWQEARQRWQARESVSIISRKIKMSKFQLEDDRFAIRADLRVVLETHGAGVYQINLFGVLDGEAELISEYALFYGIPRPTGYSPS